MKLLFDRLSSTLQHSLDMHLERGNLISSNLANVDTPGYTPVDMSFDQELAAFLDGKAPNSTPEADTEFDLYALPDKDGNSVDLDREMSKLAENRLKYEIKAKAYNKRMAMTKYAIMGN